MVTGFGEIVTKLKSFIRSGPLFSLNVEFLLSLLEYQNHPEALFWGPQNRRMSRTLSRQPCAPSWHWFFLELSTRNMATGKGEMDHCWAPCSVLTRLWPIWQRPTEALSCPRSISVRGLGWGAFECKQHSRLTRANYADSKKKKHFQKRLWVNLSCPQLPRGISNLLSSHFCGFQSNSNFSVH